MTVKKNKNLKKNIKILKIIYPKINKRIKKKVNFLKSLKNHKSQIKVMIIMMIVNNQTLKINNKPKILKKMIFLNNPKNQQNQLTLL